VRWGRQRPTVERRDPDIDLVIFVAPHGLFEGKHTELSRRISRPQGRANMNRIAPTLRLDYT
jgi:hypothetical protein